MHITFSFTSGEISYVRLPSANLHLFQSMLYSLLPADMAAKIHDEEFDSDGRKMKLFAMSWPSSSARPQFGENTMIFPLPIKLTVSTPISELITGLTVGAMSRDNIRIGNNHLVCSGVEKKEYKAGSNIITIKTLSPVTCYDSSERNGKNFTKYFTPNDDDFQRGIYFNLLRKYKLLNPGKDIPSDSFTVKPIGHVKERVSMFEKGGLFPVKGWWGRFKLEGSREILQTASAWIYFGGIGARTRRGCGTLSCDETPASLDEIVKSAKITLWRKKANDPMSAWSYAVSKYRDYRQNGKPRNHKSTLRQWHLVFSRHNPSS